jgi:hypothetical protein
MGQIWEQTQTFWFHFLLDVGTFVNVCSFTVLTLDLAYRVMLVSMMHRYYCMLNAVLIKSSWCLLIKSGCTSVDRE